MTKPLAVIKIGTALLTDPDGALRVSFLGRICEEIVAVKKAGWDIILVSSGAMASGTRLMKMTPQTLEERSIFSCVGQPLLMRYYRDFFGVHYINVAQALLTWHDFSREDTRDTIYRNMTQILEKGVIPIVNENDLVSTEEITFGDNDYLSSQVASLFKAKKLIILSDVDGLYTANPQTNADARHIQEVTEITPEIRGFIGDKTSKNSLGGMESKINAAEMAMENGVETYIASGIEDRKVIPRILVEGDTLGTRFYRP